MKNNIEISIIIPTYFHEQFIENAIKSVLDQIVDYKYEILVSDDASTDHTIEIVERYRNMYPDIISIHTYDTNVGTTQNLYDAFLRCNGRYITLLAGDDFYCNKYKLIEQKNYLDNNMDCFAVGITTKSVYMDGEDVGLFSPSPENRGKDFSRDDFSKGANYPIHGIMFRNYFDDIEVRERFHLCVEFSKYIEDLTLCLLFFEFGKVHILPLVAYAITIRRPTDSDQHNFNTIYKGRESAIMHVDLMVKLKRYFGRKVNLVNRLSNPSFEIIIYAIKERKLADLKHLKGVNILSIIKGAFTWIIKKIKGEF